MHIAAECIVTGMEDWSNIPTTKRSRRDQISPERQRSLTTVVKQMYQKHCGVQLVGVDKMTTSGVVQ